MEVYWYYVIFAVVLVIFGITQYKNAKSWLLWAVTEAEAYWGGETGQLKLAYVYDLFVDKFKFLSSVVTFSIFEKLVDSALENMREMLEENMAIQSVVIGGMIDVDY